MTDSFVVVKLVLVALYCVMEAYPQQYPPTHIESTHLYKYLPLSLSNLGKVGPIHLSIPCLNNPVTNSVDEYGAISAENVLGFDLSGFEDGFLCLLVVFLGHNFEFVSSLG